MNANGTLFVLYRVANSKTDQGSSAGYNAFEMPRSKTGSVTLADVKRNCVALRSLSHAGADGYHWRVRMDDKHGPPLRTGTRTFPHSWWDVQDEAARLPIKENVPLSELEMMFSDEAQGSSSSSSSASVSAPASTRSSSTGSSMARAVGSLAKAVATTVDGQINASGTAAPDPNEPRVSVIAFKLLDLCKLSEDYGPNNTASTARGGGGRRRSSGHTHHSSASRQAAAAAARSRPQQQHVKSTSPNAAPLPSQTQQPQQQPRRSSQEMKPRVATTTAGPTTAAAAARTRATRVQVPPHRNTSGGARTPTSRSPQRTRPAAAPTSGGGGDLLMDLGGGGGAAAAPAARRGYHHSTSAPPMMKETREERLKREYAEKQKKQNRVWDDVDKRWVVVEGNAANNPARPGRSNSEPPGAGLPSTKKNIKGVSMEESLQRAQHKSDTVRTAVNNRANTMRTNQERAKAELRQRELKKKQDEDAEDVVRRRLEPKIKAWSEEHGKKKQLAALLASLHTILWPEANWKTVNLGDLLSEKKLRLTYKKATLKVHPDKTSHLDAEKRFIAKRVFDALSQAMTEYDDAKR